MSDIVERIRQMVRDRLSGYHDPGICAELTGAADEIEHLRKLITDAIDEYPIASGLYVDTDGQDGYGALKAMRVYLGIPPSYPLSTTPREGK